MTTEFDDRRQEEQRDTTVATLVHVAGLCFGFFALAFVYLVTDDEFTRENAANALNWHIPVSLAAIVVVGIGIWVNEVAGVVLAVTVAVVTIVVALTASLAAYRGRAWEYPVVPQLI